MSPLDLLRPARRRGPETPVASGAVAVLGLGYVGLPTALSLHEAGFEVIGIDLSSRRLDQIRQGTADLLERDRERLGAALGSDRFELRGAEAALAEADAVLICVPTP